MAKKPCSFEANSLTTDQTLALEAPPQPPAEGLGSSQSRRRVEKVKMDYELSSSFVPWRLYNP